MKTYINRLRELCTNDILFDEGIEFAEDETGSTVLNFYWAVWFDPMDVFDIRLYSGDGSYEINIYVNYSIEKSCVADELDVIINHDNGSTENHSYKLSKNEKELILDAMETYCIDYSGQTLEMLIKSESCLVSDSTNHK